MKSFRMYICFIFVLMLALIISGCGGSGGSGSSSDKYEKKVYIIGEIKDPPNGREGSAMKEVFVNRVPYDGVSTDAPIFIDAGSLMSISETVQRGIKATYENLNPVVLILPTEADVNRLLEILGLEKDFKMPEGFSFLNMFAVDLEKGASFRWIMLPPLNTNYNSNPDDNNEQGEMDLANSRIDQFSDWLSENGSRMTEKEIQERQKAVDALKSATKDSTRADLESYVHGYNTTISIEQSDSFRANTYQLSFWIYALHEFKTQADWFYVRQEAQLNASGLYGSSSSWVSVPRPVGWDLKGLYIGKYEMDNYLKISKELQNSYTQILRTSPDTTTDKTEIETGMNWEFTGNVGFEGAKPTGNVGVKVDIKNNQKISIQDCQVFNKSIDNGSNAKWLFQFREVSPIVYFGYLALSDPSPLQRSVFSPQNHWLWRFTPEMRNSPEGKTFATKLTTDLVSSGPDFVDWFWSSRAKHLHYTEEWINYISLPYPPVLMADKYINITKSGQTKPIDLGVGREWTASCDQSWCRVDPPSGNADSTRVYLTVDENNTGSNRKATITFKTTDGKGTVNTDVYQSQY